MVAAACARGSDSAVLFQDDHRHGVGLGVGDGQQSSAGLEGLEDFLRLPVEMDVGPAGRFGADFHVAPADSLGPAGAESFQGRLFGGKAAGKVLILVLPGPTVLGFLFGKDPLDHLGLVLQRLTDSVNFDDVHSQTDHHSPMLRLPSPMFYEKRIRSVPFFQCSELEEIPGLVHAFTSRQTDQAFGLERVEHSGAEKTAFLDLLGLSTEKTIQIRQIHSNRVLRLASAEINRPEGDGLVLSKPGLFGVIRTADCLPMLVIDPLRRQLAAVHAGWRGTLVRILGRALAELTGTGSEPADLIVALGPCIRSCCYEVGPEFLERFAGEAHDVERIFEGRHLDLIAANRSEAEKAGVGRILDSGLCTCCSPESFYSHRRDQDRRRMWALAGFM